MKLEVRKESQERNEHLRKKLSVQGENGLGL